MLHHRLPRIQLLHFLKCLLVLLRELDFWPFFLNSKFLLCYCLPLFGGCSNLELKTLQVMQNKAAQITLSLPPRSHRDHMYDRLKWLTVNQLIVYHTLLSIHRIKNSGEPEYLANILGKSSRQVVGGIIVENNKQGLVRKSFTFRGAEQWNKLPMRLRIETKLGNFKRSL